MKVAIMGYGTIGSGVVEIIEKNNKILEKNCHEKVEVAKVLDLRDFPGSPIESKLVRDYMDIVNDPEIKCVVETMGGVEPAFTFVKAMLEARKHVCTSNKALVAAKGAELIQIAKDKNVNFFFEASVGGGIPIIRPIRTCLTAEEILEITGIMNGTTNYMLTKMSEEGSEFADVLKQAQDLGYAEKDPTADIEGHDPCRKIAILTSLAAGQQVNFEDIPCEGITKISATDIKYAKAMNRNTKLFATSRKVGDTYACMVAPFMTAVSHPLNSVRDVLNGIFVVGNMLGDSMFYGSGAGSLPTASAVVADIVDITLHQDKNIPFEWKKEPLKLASADDLEMAFFVRTKDSKDDVKSAFGDVEFIEGIEADEVGFVTSVMSQKDFFAKYEKLNKAVNRIRLA